MFSSEGTPTYLRIRSQNVEKLTRDIKFFWLCDFYKQSFRNLTFLYFAKNGYNQNQRFLLSLSCYIAMAQKAAAALTSDREKK